MHIICPHCTTSYAIDLATLGLTGRNVRCSRCKEIWLARPEDATETFAIAPAMAGADQQVGGTAGAEDWGPADREDDSNDGETPVVSSPSISGEWPAEDPDSDWPLAAQHERRKRTRKQRRVKLVSEQCRRSSQVADINF